jgi:hypothetical protein
VKVWCCGGNSIRRRNWCKESEVTPKSSGKNTYWSSDPSATFYKKS